ncbi:MAG: DNA primase [Desulfobacterales bacterium]|nr:DNA primase [Desulfobacterales bacterium]
MTDFIPEEKISEIRSAADIVEIISEAVVLKKTGRNLVGLCPFHAEKTPSFSVNPEKQIFYCFGCATGGNVFSFLMKQQGMTFPEAVKAVAQRCGIELPTREMSPLERRRLSEREVLLGLNRKTMAYYSGVLKDPAAGRTARAYLEKRRFAPAVVDRFELGYAPSGWDALIRHFRADRERLQLMEKAGLVIPRKTGSGYYDRFRDRIIFPIRNAAHQVIAFGGRVLDDGLPKYLNSPETPIYTKRRSLYGIDQAREHCRKNETVLVVEGYFDLLALHQHGIQNAVATLGTALTPEHVRSLRGCIGENGTVVLVYDSDAAGIQAAQRSIGVFDQGYADARICVLPPGHDPDSFLFEFGAAAFEQAVAKAQGIIPFLMAAAVARHGLSVDGKVQIVSELTDAIAALQDPMARSLYVKSLAERIQVDESAILERVRSRVGAKPAGGAHPLPRAPAGAGGSRPPLSAQQFDRFETRVVMMMLQYPQILPEIRQRRLLDFFENEALRSVGKMTLRWEGDPDGLNRAIDSTADADIQQLVASLVLEDTPWDHRGCLKLLDQFENSRKNKDHTILEKIKAAEKRGDHEQWLKLLQQKQAQIEKS